MLEVVVGAKDKTPGVVQGLHSCLALLLLHDGAAGWAGLKELEHSECQVDDGSETEAAQRLWQEAEVVWLAPVVPVLKRRVEHRRHGT